jgi:hypothetical protein
VGAMLIDLETLDKDLRIDPDAPAVGFDQVLGNGQPNATAARDARPRAIRPVEAVEHVRQVLGGDADAGILHARPALHLPAAAPPRSPARRRACTARHCQPG